MALADNIGYDATGRKTFHETVEREETEIERVEIHSCDLFDYRVYHEWSRESGWSERRREVIPTPASPASGGSSSETQRLFSHRPRPSAMLCGAAGRCNRKTG